LEARGEDVLQGAFAQLAAPSRLYFGVEFCQHLLPSPSDVAAARAFCDRRGWGLTLLTPYVTDAFLPAVDALFAELEPGTEVVVEDWGVLRRAREAGLAPVLGRGLHRLTRDPRLPDVGPEHLKGDAAPSSWKQGSLGSKLFRSFLSRSGVERVHVDVPMQGLSDLPVGVPVAIHLPYGMIASGRICMVSSWGKSAATRFVPPRACDAPCRRFTVELRAPWSRRDGGAESLPMVSDGAFIALSHVLNRRRNALPDAYGDSAPRFIQKGNTHFYRLEGDALDRARDWALGQAAVDRVVVELDLPM
jgi:hypothetical protein